MSALITQYSSANREVEAALNVIYYKRLAQGTWVGTSVVSSTSSVTYSYMDEYHRVARKTYKYVGMTEDAAKSCAADMRTLYTRTVRYQKWDPTAGTMGDWEIVQATGTEMSAEIVARHVAGDMWETTISVNEDSVFFSKTDTPRSYETIFAPERNRTYDGESES